MLSPWGWGEVKLSWWPFCDLRRPRIRWFRVRYCLSLTLDGMFWSEPVVFASFGAVLRCFLALFRCFRAVFWRFWLFRCFWAIFWRFTKICIIFEGCFIQRKCAELRGEAFFLIAAEVTGVGEACRTICENRRKFEEENVFAEEISRESGEIPTARRKKRGAPRGASPLFVKAFSYKSDTRCRRHSRRGESVERDVGGRSDRGKSEARSFGLGDRSAGGKILTAGGRRS